MSKREVPKLKKDNFIAWYSLIKFHLGSIGDYGKNSIRTEHVDPSRPLSTYDLRKRNEHNQVMLEIASALSYVEFHDIKGCDTTLKMWKTLVDIYGGYQNVERAKREILRGNFDDMKWRKEKIFLNMAPK